MSALEDLMRAAAETGAHVTLLRSEKGDFVAGTSRPAIERYVTRRDVDPIAALRATLIEDDRQTRDAPRVAAAAVEPGQIDLEDAIAATGDDEFADMLG